MVNVGEIFVARQAFDAGTFGFGLLASASGTGIVLGSMLAGRIAADSATRRPASGWPCSRRDSAPRRWRRPWVAARARRRRRLGNAVFLAASTLVVQESTEDGARGHAFAIFDAAGFVALAVGMAQAAGAIVSRSAPAARGSPPPARSPLSAGLAFRSQPGAGAGTIASGGKGGVIVNRARLISLLITALIIAMFVGGMSDGGYL